jgi:hypothetical protein
MSGSSCAGQHREGSGPMLSQGASAAISIFLPVFRVHQFTNKPEIMLMLRARIAVLKAKERRP